MLRSTVRYTCTKHKVIYVETENRNDGNNHCWQDSFLLPTWHQILLHFRNELFSQNMGKRFQAGTRQPLHSCRSNSKLGAIGIAQYFPVSFLPPHMQEQSCTQVVSPQETPGYNATFVIIDFDCVAAEWVMYVYLCLLLVFIPCYFWSHSIPGRLNMEQESDASLIALTTHFAQVNETKKKKKKHICFKYNLIP